jgi:hypothetical protein
LNNTSYADLTEGFSVIDGGKIVNIKDLIPTSNSTPIDAYTKAQVDEALLLRQNTLNWLTGDSNGKNTISTGNGLLYTER